MLTFSRQRYRLDGTWRMAPDPFDLCEQKAIWEAHDTADELSDRVPAEWPEVQVPSCWNAAWDELEYYEGPVWYWRRFRFEARRSQRYLLHFEAANYSTKVWVNGRFVGENEGGFTPFWFDVTEQLAASNTILVKVDARRRADGVPALVYDWFNFGGITRPVSIVTVPESHIRNFRVSTRLDGARTFVRFDVWTEGPAGGHVRIKIPEVNFEDALPCARGGHCSAEFEIYPDLWSPDNPRLYTVELLYGSDRVSDAVGFRELGVQDDEILLNGKPVRLYGICLHEEADRSGRTLTERDVAQRFRWARELHASFLRLAHYPHTEQMARTADRLGFLLWEEIPVYWEIAFTSKATLANAKRQMRLLVERDWNRASVAFWSIGNETDASRRGRNAFMGALADFTRKLDPTRLVTAACSLRRTDPGHVALDDPLAAKLDVIGINEYFGWYVGAVEDFAGWQPGRRETKPIIISETGADAVAGHHGAKGVRWTEEFQADFHRRQLAVLDALPGVRGIAPWLLFDFRSPLRTNRYQRGYNRKGLISNAGNKKLAFGVLAGFYAGKRGIKGHVPPARSGGGRPRRGRGVRGL